MPYSSYCKAVSLYNNGKLDDSKNLFKSLQQSDNVEDAKYRDAPNVNRRLGIIALSETNYELASVYFKRALDLCLITECYFDSYLNEECGGKNVDDDALAWTYHDYGYSLFAQNDLSEAKKWLEKAKEIRPENQWFTNDLGYYYYKLGDWKNAEKLFIDTLIDNKNNENGYSYILLGRTYYKKESPDKAMEMFDNAQRIFIKKLGIDNKNELLSILAAPTKEQIGYAFQIVDIFNNKSRIELDKMNYDKAENLLTDADKLGDLCENKIKSIENIYPSEKRAFNETRAATCNNLGLLYYKKGLYEAAKKEYERALGKYESAEIYYNLGILYRDLGDEKRAEALIRIAQRVDPKIGKAKDFLSSTEDDKPFSWWNWWFGERGSVKSYVGMLLAVACGYFILMIGIASLPSATILTNETKIVAANNATYVLKSAPVSIESQIIIIALLAFFLILPQVKSFSAKDAKFELEPISKGSGGKQQKD